MRNAWNVFVAGCIAPGLYGTPAAASCANCAVRVIAPFERSRTIRLAICRERLLQTRDEDAVLLAEVRAESFIELPDDLRESLYLRRGRGASSLLPDRVNFAAAALQGKPAAEGLPDPIGLHVDVLLDLPRQLVMSSGQVAPKQSREHIQLLEAGIGEREDLGEEGIEPHIVVELVVPVHEGAQQAVRLSFSPLPASRPRAHA